MKRKEIREETNKLFELYKKAREFKGQYLNATSEAMYYHYKALYNTTLATITITQSHIKSLRRIAQAQ